MIRTVDPFERLISEKQVNEKLLQLSLEGLKQLASNERDNINSTKHLFGAAKSNFSTDVRELISRIRRVLSSTQQMKIFEDDPEMFVELQHVMAQEGFHQFFIGCFISAFDLLIR